ncbi:MAG: hypothetical protein ACRDGE_03635 [Candidatus Limnocylindria bacterium]
MRSAVHSDRSGRVYVSADYSAAAFDGASLVPLSEALPLPPGAELVPVPREAEALDRAGRPRGLGRSRWALAALLPRGHTRTLLPAYRDEGGEDIAPLPYAAVAADAGGELVVAALRSGTPDAARPEPAAVEDAVKRALRAWPSSRLVRQLARCAREYGCAGARSALLGRGEAALPMAAPANERPATVLALHSDRDARPAEPATFSPVPDEIADVAAAHLAEGGDAVAFGRACEGEPLLSIRVLEQAVRLIRERTDRGRIVLETNGSSPAALRRAIEAGVDEVVVRLASARAATYELLHGPQGYRWTDVRASLAYAAERRGRLRLALLVLPGLTDRPGEVEALLALLGDLPGGAIELRDLGADPLRALALAPSTERPVGVRATLVRLAREASHFPHDASIGAAA